MDAIYDCLQVAELVGVSRRTVVGWIDSGQLKAFDASATANSKKRRWRVQQASLDAFLRSREPASPNPRKKRSTRKPSKCYV